MGGISKFIESSPITRGDILASGGGGGKGGPLGGLTNAFQSVVNSNPFTKAISDTVANVSDSIGLKKPLDNLMPKMPEPPPISAPAMQGQTVGMSGGDTAAAGGDFDLGKDEDEQTLRSRRKKRRGRVELMGPGVGVGTGTSDVGVKI